MFTNVLVPHVNKMRENLRDVLRERMIRDAQTLVTSFVMKDYSHAIRHKLRVDELRRLFICQAALGRYAVKFRWKKNRQAAKLVHQYLSTINVLTDMKKGFKAPQIIGP